MEPKGGRETWALIGLGQLLSLAISTTAITSGALESSEASFPTFQSFLGYALIALTHGSRFFYGLFRGTRELAAPWWAYILLAVGDVESNFLMVTAYRYTSVTSVMLLSSWTIPCVMLLSVCFLGRRYSRQHVLGAALCVAGLVMLIMTDKSTSEAVGSTALGNGIALLGATLYACLNVSQEKVLGEAPALEFLAMVGTIATGISAFQAGVLETQTLKHPFSATQAVLLLLFALALLSFYSGAPVVIVRAGAAFLNLSLLSSQLWATVARIALFGGFPSPLAALAFAVSLSVTAAGLVTFSLADREQELLQSYEHVLPETHPGGRGDARGCRADSDEAACGRAGSLGASPVDCSTRVCDAETRRGAGKGRRVGAAEEEMASLDRAMCVEGMADVAPDGTSCGGAAGHLRGIGRSLVGRGGVDDPPDDVSRQGLLGQ